jgi:opacity protein-like surface antigen
MKFNKWTLGLAAVGVVSLASAAMAQDVVAAATAGTTISGYVDASAQWNPGTGNANPPPYAFNQGKADGFNLNVAQVSIAKALDESQWAAGYHVDLWFGPDAKTLGTSSYLGLANLASDLAIRQAYVQLRTPIAFGDLSWKIGVFDTIIGYESLSSPNNPHYSRSYGFGLEPTTHTGLLGTYQATESVGVSFGVANTMGPSINERAFGTPIPASVYGSPTATLPLGGNKAESYKTYMGSLSLTAPQSFGFLAGSSLYGGIIGGFSSGNYGNQVNYYAGATISTPVTGLKFGAAFDYLSAPKHAYDVTSIGGPATYRAIPDSYSVAGYASFLATEKLTFLGRAEYLDSMHDTSNIFALTGTVQYDLWKNVISRLEVRWDHAEHGKLFGGTPVTVDNITNINQLLGVDATRENAFMLAANIIYKF